MNTFSKLYLGSEPVGVAVQDDQLAITLADGRTVKLPLQVVSQIGQAETWPDEAQVLVLRKSPQIDHVHVTDSALNVYLKDGRLLSCPLAWFPRLLHGAQAERNYYELSGYDDVIHWPDLDEDVELSRLFEGGASIESERSLQRWLATRSAHTGAMTATRNAVAP